MTKTIKLPRIIRGRYGFLNVDEILAWTRQNQRTRNEYYTYPFINKARR